MNLKTNCPGFLAYSMQFSTHVRVFPLKLGLNFNILFVFGIHVSDLFICKYCAISGVELRLLRDSSCVVLY